MRPISAKSIRTKESLQEILDMLGEKKITVTGEDGESYIVKGSSLRLLTFKETGTLCPMCNAQATHWEITWDSNPNPHINLVGEDDLLFTHDHIIPLSQGGDDNLENTHTMCSPCNWFLGNKTKAEYKGFLYSEINPKTIKVFFNTKENLWVTKARKKPNGKPKIVLKFDNRYDALQEAVKMLEAIT